MTITRKYSELRHLQTFEERFDYLALRGSVGRPTFGFERYMNQRFYTSMEWRRTRRDIIARDNGCDLGVEGFEINSKIIIHHLNPITTEMLTHGDDIVFDPDNLITTTHDTHNAIHYGDRSNLKLPFVERRPGDTDLWTPMRGGLNGYKRRQRSNKY